MVGASVNPLHIIWPVRHMARRVTCHTAVVTAVDMQKRAVTYQTFGGGTACQEHPGSLAGERTGHRAADRPTPAVDHGNPVLQEHGHPSLFVSRLARAGRA